MTLTVKIPDETEARLHERVSKDELALSEFVLQAIAEKLEREVVAVPSAEVVQPEKPTAYERGKHLFGKYSSGREDLSENYEAILKEKLRAQHRG